MVFFQRYIHKKKTSANPNIIVIETNNLTSHSHYRNDLTRKIIMTLVVSKKKNFTTRGKNERKVCFIVYSRIIYRRESD